jgi:peptide/nickel transport system substrate-binding protein
MIYHSSEIDRNNWSRYSNPELDDLLRKGRETLNWEDRKSIYQKVVEILKEEMPAMNFYKPLRAFAIRDYVKGFREGFGMRFAWHGGGAKYWWLDK